MKQLLRLLKPSPYLKSQEFLFRKLRSGYFRFLKCRHAQTQSALSAPDPLPAFWSGSEGLPFPVRKQPEYILFDPPDKFHRWNLLFRGGAVSADFQSVTTVRSSSRPVDKNSSDDSYEMLFRLQMSHRMPFPLSHQMSAHIPSDLDPAWNKNNNYPAEAFHCCCKNRFCKFLHSSDRFR